MQKISFLVLFILLANHVCFAEGIQASPDPTQNFDIAYGMSFGFDQCGDSTLGDGFRKALIERIENCHLSSDALEKFKQLADQNKAAFVVRLNQYKEKYGSMPISINGQNCDNFLNSPSTNSLREKVENYVNGTFSASDVVTLSCTTNSTNSSPSNKTH